MLCNIDFLCIFAPLSLFGVLAHLARALDWQSKGGEFESRMLHSSNLSVSEGFVLFKASLIFVLIKTVYGNR